MGRIGYGGASSATLLATFPAPRTCICVYLYLYLYLVIEAVCDLMPHHKADGPVVHVKRAILLGENHIMFMYLHL